MSSLIPQMVETRKDFFFVTGYVSKLPEGNYHIRQGLLSLIN
jgi:hypothetical protein